MLVITGVFENERFIPDKPISVPQKKKGWCFPKYDALDEAIINIIKS
jgi:hypothetical protein